jgi:hypothetical protein
MPCGGPNRTSVSWQREPRFESVSRMLYSTPLGTDGADGKLGPRAYRKSHPKKTRNPRVIPPAESPVSGKTNDPMQNKNIFEAE